MLVIVLVSPLGAHTLDTLCSRNRRRYLTALSRECAPTLVEITERRGYQGRTPRDQRERGRAEYCRTSRTYLR
jgi:hypothetical protein